MSGLRIGSLFSGYGGLDAGVQAAIGGDVAWHCEIEPAAARLLEHHHPDVPNLGDITAVDWPNVAPVDVLTGGFPCQDVSSAGRRAGMRPDNRSGLWAHMARAINVLRPELVVIENVRGLLSAEAACDVEPCPWCLGDQRDRPLRALGAVLGDLAVLGYDARWHGLRAADAGAPHGRFRVFIVAWPAQDADGAARGQRRVAAPGQAPGGRAWADAGRPDRARTAADTAGPGRGPLVAQHVADDGGETVRAGQTKPGRRDRAATADTDGGELQRRRVGGVVDGAPGPGEGEGPQRERDRDAAEHGVETARWGGYEPAIRRWELTLGRPAPGPTNTGARGGRTLSPLFVEWLMGLPAGHVTDVPGLSRNDQLKLLGNGVVPQQAELAVRHMLAADTAERVA